MKRSKLVKPKSDNETLLNSTQPQNEYKLNSCTSSLAISIMISPSCNDFVRYYIVFENINQNQNRIGLTITKKTISDNFDNFFFPTTNIAKESIRRNLKINEINL